MSEPITVSTTNIDTIIRGVKEQLRKANALPRAEFLWVPRSMPVLNYERYQGRGRPRNTDYDYEEIDWSAFSSM